MKGGRHVVYVRGALPPAQPAPADALRAGLAALQAMTRAAKWSALTYTEVHRAPALHISQETLLHGECMTWAGEAWQAPMGHAQGASIAQNGLPAAELASADAHEMTNSATLGTHDQLAA